MPDTTTCECGNTMRKRSKKCKDCHSFKETKIIIKDDYVLVPVQGRQYLILDKADLPLVEPGTWRLKDNGSSSKRAFKTSKRGSPNVYLHRLMLTLLPGQRIKFLDGDVLNYRRSNIVAINSGELIKAAQLTRKKPSAWKPQYVIE